MTMYRRDPVGAPGVPVGHDHDVDIHFATRQGRQLHWGPIWAGLLTSFGVFLLLSLLAVGIGIQTIGEGDADTVATIIASVIGLVALAAGGFIAAWSAVVGNPARGLLYGFLVWALWLAVLVVMAGFGFGTLLGNFGGVLADLQAPELTQAEITDILEAGALGSFLALALTAAAGMLGGVLGAMAVPDRVAVDSDAGVTAE
jgi:MFS family permease